MNYFSAEEILELHYRLVEDYGGSHGVRDEGRLHSLVYAPQTTAFGADQYDTPFLKAAVYMRNCIADHMFADGNKRTGTTLAGVFLMRCGYGLTATPKELEDFAVSVAVDHLEVEGIAAWLEEHSTIQGNS